MSDKDELQEEMTVLDFAEDVVKSCFVGLCYIENFILLGSKSCFWNELFSRKCCSNLK